METCKLCRENPPDKKNAHLIPHFLIKTAINEGGTKEREKELVFGLSSNGLVDVYFGRDLSVEKIHEILGREETDEEIANRQNPFARDYLICTSCEKKLSVLEGYIAQELYNPLIMGKKFEVEHDRAGRSILTSDQPSPHLFALLVYSIFWRTSAGDYAGFRLRQKIEEGLRVYLNKYLNLDINAMKATIEQSIQLPYPITITFAPSTKGADPTVNSITAESSRFPYFITANAMTFQLFEKAKQVKASVQHLHGLSQMVDKIAGCMFDASYIKLALLTEDQGNAIMNYPLLEFASKEIKLLRRAFQELCLRVFGRRPSFAMESSYMQNFMKEGVPLGAQYTTTHMAQCAMDTFTEFGLVGQP